MFVNPLLLMFILMVLLLALKVPVPFALGFSCVVYLFLADIPMTLVAQQFIVRLNSFTLLAVPFFVLAGQFMSRGGIMRRLIKFAEALIGHRFGKSCLDFRGYGTTCHRGQARWPPPKVRLKYQGQSPPRARPVCLSNKGFRNVHIVASRKAMRNARSDRTPHKRGNCV